MIKWEEFALFGCHYFLLVAENTGNESEIASSSDRMSNLTTPVFAAETKYSENPKSQGLRRFAAALPVRVSGLLVDGVGNFGGMGLNARVASHDIYLPVPNQAGNLPASISATNSSPSSRMCKISPYFHGRKCFLDDASCLCSFQHHRIS